MLMILSLSRLDDRSAEDYLRLLGLPMSTPYRESLTDEPVGKQDRVILITPLDNEGDRRQRNLIRDNRDVGEWLVLSENTRESALKRFQDAVSEASSAVFVFSNIEALREKLRQKPMKSHACLIATPPSMQAEAEMFRHLMLDQLHGWLFETASSPLSEGQLADTDFAKVFLLGRKYSDFRAAAPWPSHLTVFLVCADEEAARRDVSRLRRSCFSQAGLKLSETWQEEHFFIANLRYEMWRQELADGRITSEYLAQNPDFVMWDAFDLPCPVDAYTAENIHSFLNRFDRCARIAASLR